MEFTLPCVETDASARPLHAVRPAGLDALLASLTSRQGSFLKGSGFAARPQELVLLPGVDGVEAAVLGLGDDRSPYAFGDLAYRLPEGSVWDILSGDHDRTSAVLGYCLGGYRFRAFKPPKREPARLIAGRDDRRARSLAAASWMVRDLINTPANLLGPAELADAALALAERHGAAPHRVAGADLERDYPAVAAVGAGSVRAPVVAGFSWRGSRAEDASPLLAMCC